MEVMPMALFDTTAIAAAANADGEFQLAARLWNTDLRFDVGDDSYLLRMRDGRIAEFAPLGASAASSVNTDAQISAPLDDWQELLKPVPKPFYQDLMAAVTRHNFKIEGDLTGFHPYYRATCRLIELMRQSRS
ncbi:MAG: hypothetical protein Q7S58_17010 [Candidatus Binatus sp.]|uniref:hypothetical protein n=1 Tax=Candidatus Binatus sp. TaxID=2811406 RepID=UPI00271E069A|nr:hypothetical protein [Candidatus Binatus sp.]MDO8434100.1 hypothetical protein [Candidatus Binatus sp.]